MRGKPVVIEQLNAMLLTELTAINQYFLHARMLKNWGFRALGERIYRESLGEMRHADRLTERILFLEGLPNLQTIGKLHIGEDAPEVLTSDLALERAGRDLTAASVTVFEREGDFVSRDLATNILRDSEEHIDLLETQLSLLQSMGRENYLQTAVIDIPSV